MSEVTTEDVIYHGYRRAMGGSFIAVKTPDGEQIGVVNHVAKHSPTGMSWGYGGSGAADCARSLLIAALGDEASCCACGATKKIVFDVETEKEAPYDPVKADIYDPELIASCSSCDEGYRVMPSVYQDFKWTFVAGWGDEWQMRRSEILAWFQQNGDSQ